MTLSSESREQYRRSVSEEAPNKPCHRRLTTNCPLFTLLASTPNISFSEAHAAPTRCTLLCGVSSNYLWPEVSAVRGRSVVYTQQSFDCRGVLVTPKSETQPAAHNTDSVSGSGRKTHCMLKTHCMPKPSLSVRDASWCSLLAAATLSQDTQRVNATSSPVL